MQAQLDLIGIVVEDMPRSLRVYRALGLNVPAEADEESHVEIHLPGGMRLAWDTVANVHSFDPDWEPASGDPSIGLAFLLGAPPEVDEAYSELLALGCTGHKAPWDAFWGQRYASLRDPDGNSIDLFAPLAG